MKLELLYGEKTIRVIKSDPNRLKQIVINLLSNAIKYTIKGHVQISAKEFVNNSSECQIQMQVADTGIGMSPAKVDNLNQISELEN